MDATTSKMDKHMKRKLQSFLLEMCELATVRGFKYFSTYLRGREEMIISIANEMRTPSNSYVTEPNTPTVAGEFNLSSSFNSQHLPYDRHFLFHSQMSQVQLSGAGDGIGLPPASPSDTDQRKDDSTTLFLIAGYTRYQCPYVWVRSNHERLVKLAGGASVAKDSPLKLRSTSRWKSSEIFVDDVVTELVKLCTYPAPKNPFSVDFEYFDSLPGIEKLLATAAMIHSLHRVILHSDDEKAYTGLVFEELQIITDKHYEALQSLTKQGAIPVLQSYMQAKRAAQNPQRDRNLSSGQRCRVRSISGQRSRYPPEAFAHAGIPGHGYGGKVYYGVQGNMEYQPPSQVF